MKNVEKLIPKYAVISLVFCFAWNCFVYWTTQFLCAGRRHFDLTTDFDRWVPVQSWWVLIYVASFAFWVICYILIARFNDREFWFRFVTADLLSRTICGVIFVVFPTMNTRPVLKMSRVAKGGVLAFALLIFASTQFTKQHYISDVISGVVLALLCYSIAMKTDIARPVRKVFERINEKVFGDANEEKKEGTV